MRTGLETLVVAIVDIRVSLGCHIRQQRVPFLLEKGRDVGCISCSGSDEDLEPFIEPHQRPLFVGVVQDFIGNRLVRATRNLGLYQPLI